MICFIPFLQTSKRKGPLMSYQLVTVEKFKRIFPLVLMSFHIKARSADLQTTDLVSDQTVVVGVIDTGVDIDHRLLKDNIWTNAGETGVDQLGRRKESNGVDDDGNGYIDDVHGWNFVENNNQVFDDVGHGTHVAGIVHQQFSKFKVNRNNQLKIMSLRFYNSKLSAEKIISNGVKAIEYAIKMKAHILNYSGGGVSPDIDESKAILKAQNANMILVAAAGNNHQNADIEKFYPAGYGYSNIIRVASIDSDTSLSRFSNFGVKTVDIAAPGNRILSAAPKNTMEYLSGTSQSTAYVTGRLAAAHLTCSSCSLEMRKNLLFLTAKKINQLKGFTKTQLALVDE